jgi:hypothetical protein
VNETHHLTGDGLEELHAWMLVFALAALEDPQALRLLIAVVEREVERKLKASCWKSERLLNPCWQ